MNIVIMMEQLTHTFSAPDMQGYLVRCFLQTADEYRERSYSALNDEEFEALKRVYRHIYNSPYLTFRSSYNVSFTTNNAAISVLNEVTDVIKSCKDPNDLYPQYKDKVCIEPAGSTPYEVSDEFYVDVLSRALKKSELDSNDSEVDLDTSDWVDEEDSEDTDAFKDLIAKLEMMDLTPEQRLLLVNVISQPYS